MNKVKVVTAVAIAVLLVAVVVVVIVCSITPEYVKVPPDHIQIFTRHGERYPVVDIPELGNYSLGGLTDRGRKEEVALGARFRRIYNDFFEMTVVSRFISVNSSRSVESTQLLFEGLEIKPTITDKLLPFFSPDTVNNSIIDGFFPESSDLYVGDECVARMLEDIADKSISEDVHRNISFYRFNLVLFLLDSLDTLRRNGYNGKVHGVNITECSDGPFLSAKNILQTSMMCMESFCRPVVRKVIQQLQELSNSEDTHATFTVYGVSDVHVQGILYAILPDLVHPRLGFGGFAIFENRLNEITILVGSDQSSKPVELGTLGILEVIDRLKSTL